MERINELLINYSYYICLFVFVCFVVALCLNRRVYGKVFCGISRRHWGGVYVVFLVALYIRLFLIAHQHYVFYDEYEHVNIAKMLLEQKQFARCDFYLDGACRISSLPHWTPGFHFLLSLAFGLYGVSAPNAFVFSAIVGSLTVAAVFFATYLLTEKTLPATISAVLTALLPLHVKLSGSSCLEVTSFFFITASVISALIFRKSQTERAFFLFITTTAVMCLMRPENGLLMVPLLILVSWKTVGKRRYIRWIPSLALFIPYLAYLPNAWMHSKRAWLIRVVGLNLWEVLGNNLLYWVSNYAIPLSYTAMAFLGIVLLVRWKKRRTVLFCCVFFVSFLVFYVVVHKAILYKGDFQRFNLQFILPVIVLASVGFADIASLLRQAIKSDLAVIFLLGGITVMSAVGCFYFFPDQLSDPRLHEQHKSLLEGEAIDAKALFVAYNPPSVVSTINKSSVYINFVFDRMLYEGYMKGRRLILVNDYWCKQDRDGLFKALKERYDLSPIQRPQGGRYRLFYDLKERRLNPR